MTKKDYVLIANVLKDLGNDAAHCFDSAHDRINIAARFAVALGKDNPMFDNDRFITAAMETKNYAVAVKRNSTDFILISATSEEDAKEKVRSLIDAGTQSITLGDDGYDEEIIDATLDEPADSTERADLECNNAAVGELESEDGASV